MTPTDLSRLPVPGPLRELVVTVDVAAYIHGHSVAVNRAWWHTALTAHGFPDDLLAQRITRGDLFELADAATAGRDGALRLLWNAVAWGSGMKPRLGRARIRAVAADPDHAADLLRTAARLARSSPREAYALLRPGDRSNAIGFLGPAFFTKYLYFAGGGRSDHPCCILDARVATTLHRAGWSSLPTDTNWLASAYQRYNELLADWKSRTGAPRLDVIERWLFDQAQPR